MEVGTWRGSNGLLYRWRPERRMGEDGYTFDYSAGPGYTWGNSGCWIPAPDMITGCSQGIVLHCYGQEMKARRLEDLAEQALEAATRAQERTQDAIASQGTPASEIRSEASSAGIWGFHAVAPFERDDNGLQPLGVE